MGSTTPAVRCAESAKEDYAETFNNARSKNQRRALIDGTLTFACWNRKARRE